MHDARDRPPGVYVTADWDEFVEFTQRDDLVVATYLVEHSPEVAAAYARVAELVKAGQVSFTSGRHVNNRQLAQLSPRLLREVRGLLMHEAFAISDDIRTRLRQTQSAVFKDIMTSVLVGAQPQRPDGGSFHYDLDTMVDLPDESYVYLPYGSAATEIVLGDGSIYRPPVQSISVFPGHKIKHRAPAHMDPRIRCVAFRRVRGDKRLPTSR